MARLPSEHEDMKRSFAPLILPSCVASGKLQGTGQSCFWAMEETSRALTVTQSLRRCPTSRSTARPTRPGLQTGPAVRVRQLHNVAGRGARARRVGHQRHASALYKLHRAAGGIGEVGEVAGAVLLSQFDWQHDGAEGTPTPLIAPM